MFYQLVTIGLGLLARAIDSEMKVHGFDCVYLDISHRDPDFVRGRFPTVLKTCRRFGIDMTREPIPVVPAAHYSCGGVVADLEARTALPRLYACGEVACSGLHGANRLASNSLLETLVFGARVAADAGSRLAPRESANPPVSGPPAAAPPPQRLRELMSLHAGIERDARGLAAALEGIAAIERAGAAAPALLNMTAAAKLVAAAAFARRESRGAHFRGDYPQTDEPARRTFLTLAEAERISGQASSFDKLRMRFCRWTP